MGDAYARLLAKQSGLKAEPVHNVTTLPPRPVEQPDAEPEFLPESNFWLVQCPCCRFPLLARNPNDRTCPGCLGKGATGCPNHEKSEVSNGT